MLNLVGLVDRDVLVERLRFVERGAVGRAGQISAGGCLALPFPGSLIMRRTRLLNV